jgi:hypothetical protein
MDPIPTPISRSTSEGLVVSNPTPSSSDKLKKSASMGSEKPKKATSFFSKNSSKVAVQKAPVEVPVTRSEPPKVVAAKPISKEAKEQTSKILSMFDDDMEETAEADLGGTTSVL